MILSTAKIKYYFGKALEVREKFGRFEKSCLKMDRQKYSPRASENSQRNCRPPLKSMCRITWRTIETVLSRFWVTVFLFIIYLFVILSGRKIIWTSFVNIFQLNFVLFLLTDYLTRLWWLWLYVPTLSLPLCLPLFKVTN